MTDIQWDQPLEAVHEDGRVVPVAVQQDRRDDFILIRLPDGLLTYFNRVTGVARYHNFAWRIRNTPQQTPTPDVVGKDQFPDFGNMIAPELKPTCEEQAQVASEVDRLRSAITAALQCTPVIRVLGGNHGQPCHVIQYDCGDPWQILREALLPEPVDGDLVEARRLACENSRWERDGEQWLSVEQGKQDHIPLVQAALAAIRRGRALERGEA